MNNKADLEHTQPISSIIDLENTLSVKADLNHTHTGLNNLTLSGTTYINLPSSYSNYSAISVNLQDVNALYDGNIPNNESESHYWWFSLSDSDGISPFQCRTVKYSSGSFLTLFRFPSPAINRWIGNRFFTFSKK